MRTIGLHWEKGAFDIFIGKIFIWKKISLLFRLTEETQNGFFYLTNLNVNTGKVNVLKIVNKVNLQHLDIQQHT